MEVDGDSVFSNECESTLFLLSDGALPAHAPGAMNGPWSGTGDIPMASAFHASGGDVPMNELVPDQTYAPPVSDFRDAAVQGTSASVSS